MIDTKIKESPQIQAGMQNFYLPIAKWVENIIKKAPVTSRPCIIGINGPQGSGKSTLVRILSEELFTKNYRSAILSVDDFYLTYQEQNTLSKLHSNNPYLQQRGYPGTHDVSLGCEVLSQLKKINSGSKSPVQIPVYDKSKNNGRGDRLAESEWIQVNPGLDIILFEGWMLGFKQVPKNLLNNPHFEEVNDFLPAYESWTQHLDGFIQLVPNSLAYIIDWRVEAEEKMKALGKTGMTTEEVTAYIKKFIPAYQIYLPRLMTHPPVVNNYLQFQLGKNRLPLGESI